MIDAGSGDPFRRLAGGAEPDRVLGLMAEVVAAALEADTDAVIASALARGDDGRIAVGSAADGAVATEDDEALLAPEAYHTGPTPAGLVFTVAAIGVRAATGRWTPPPAPGAAGHDAWRAAVIEALGARWGPAGRAARDLIARCLDADPFARPHPRHLSEALAGLGAVGPSPRRGPARRSGRSAAGGRILRGAGWAALAGAVVLTVLGGFGLGLLLLDGARPDPGEPPAPAHAVEGTAAVAPVDAPDPVPPVEEEPPPPPTPVPALAPAPVAPRPAPATPAPASDGGVEVRNDLMDPWE